LSRRSLGEGGWFVLFASGKLKYWAFHALFVFPFQSQEKQSHPASGPGIYCLWASKKNEQ
jgi:hypothetical protein